MTADDWARAALEMIGEGGLAAVAVEPLAARLGTTKGSFYWHFPNRQALLEAAVRLWETAHTDHVIASIDADPDPAQRLRRLITLVVDVSRDDRIEVALLASANDPLVEPAIQRATERRIGYVASLYEELGWAPDDARHRAVLAVSVYLGHVQLAHAAASSLPQEPQGWKRHVDALIGTLLTPDRERTRGDRG